jgi:aminoglycoside phosphotransferase (APT) family kinase protein
MSDRGLSPDEAAAAVEGALGVRPTAVERMPYGHFNVTYTATLPDGREVIVRTNRDPAAMRGVKQNLPILAGLGLPVPRLLHAGETYLILAKIPGRDLGFELPTMDEAQMARVAEQVVGFQRAAMTLPLGQGYGWHPIGQVGRHATWGAVIDYTIEKELMRSRDLLPEDTEPRLLRRADELRAYFDAVPPTPHLDDLTTKNVIVEHGVLRGIVDFDVICYGDPLYWLGLTRTAVISQVPEKRFYVDELVRLWGADPEIVRFYSALFVLDFIGYGRSRNMAPETLARLLELL